MKSLVLVILLTLIAPNLRADSVILKSEPEMVASADFIAIIEFQSVERGVFKGTASYPKQREKVMKRCFRRVSARVIENLKGEMPGEIQIYDSSGFWDALFQSHLDQAKSDSGRYLIFLTGNVDFLTGSNGWASTSRIASEEIEWTENPNSPKFQMVNLKSVLDRVREQIKTR